MVLQELMQGLTYSCTGSADAEITGIVYDSRRVTKGCAFVCLCGSATDSHAFAADAVKAGAAAVVVQRSVEAPGGNLVTVENTRLALAKMSAAWFGHPAAELTVVGVTGTKGKTTTAYMIRAILEEAGVKTGIIGTIGVVIGDELITTENTTPESYDVQRFFRRMADAGCGAVVMEASSIGLRDFRVAGFTFDVGVFTNFSEDHLGGNEHKDMAEYLACKNLLFRHCRTGVVNIDDEHWEGVTSGHTCKLHTYGFAPEAELRAARDALVSRPGYLGVHFDLQGQMEFPVDVDIPGKFNVYNALAAAQCASLFPQVTRGHITAGLNRVQVKGRVEAVPVPGDYTLLIDYAHNAVSMRSILSTLRAYFPERLVVLFGAGGNRPKLRRYEMGEVCGRLADLSVVTADNSRDEEVADIIADIRVGMDKTGGEYLVIPDRTEAIEYVINNARSGDIVVLAGKGHEDYQEIKGVKRHFDEREIIAQALAKRGRAQ